MRYFTGTARDLGTVSAAPFSDFAQLAAHLAKPVVLPFTQAALLAMPYKEQQRAKAVEYVTPTCFKNPTSPRTTAEATHCNLIALDIDDAAEAQRVLKLDLDDILGGLGYVVWHTARSTPEAPRLRVLVSAEAIPVSAYRAAVRSIASLLGLEEPTTESMVAVQPMYVPTVFTDSTGSPIVRSNPEGEPFVAGDITAEDQDNNPSVATPSDPDGPVQDITHLRSPLEGVTTEDAAGALAVLDPDCAMGQWIEVGAALKHQFGEQGYQLWDTWSAKGKKYDADEMAGRWRSLKANPADRAPVTLRSVFRLAKARGWVNLSLAAKAKTATMEWLQAGTRSTEELLDQGPARIAQVSPSLDLLERKTLVVALAARLKALKMPLPIADLRRKVRELETAATKTGVPPWAKGLCYLTATNQFYRFTTDRRFSPEVIDLMYSLPSNGEEKTVRPRDYLIQVADVPQVENVRYEPQLGTKRFITVDDKPYVNIYRPSRVIPNADRAAEAGEIFTAHLGHLIAEPEYQRTLIDFIAFHVQHPGLKIRWAVLLQSTPGAGKTFVASAASAVLGHGNVRKLSASAVMESQYNDWAYGRQMIVMEEVRVVGSNRYAVMDKLKPLISDDEISYSKKYEDHQSVPNICNYLMFTNHHGSLAVHDDDRRYFVLASPMQRPDQVAALGGQDYFNQLFGMLRDNVGGLRAWFESWTITSSFNPDGRAPTTKYLRELADASASPLTACVRQAIEDEAHPLVRRDLLSMGCLRSAMNVEAMKGFSDQALANVLRELGYEKRGRYTLENARHSLWTLGQVSDPVGKAGERLEYL